LTPKGNAAIIERMFGKASRSLRRVAGEQRVRAATGKGPEMGRVSIGMTGAATVSRLLGEISAGGGVSDDLRDRANYLALSVQRRMDRRDVEMIAWVLRSASVSHGIPTAKQKRAHDWASYLEGRL
jgi:hypothetical protein